MKHKSTENLFKFFPVAWMGHIGLGLTYGIMGPAQPYLASQVNVGHQAIAFLWSSRATGITLACVTTGYIFGSKYCSKATNKLYFLATVQFLASVCLLAIPFIQNYMLLLLMFGLLTFSTGSFDVADNSLMNNMLGPEKSRPMVQSLHACVASGFVMVATAMAEYLPQSPSTKETICTKLKHGGQGNLTNVYQEEDAIVLPLISQGEMLIEDETFHHSSNVTSDFNSQVTTDEDGSILPILTWPYLFIGSWQFLVGFGFCMLALKGVEIPDYYSAPVENTKEPLEDPIVTKRPSPPLSSQIYVLVGLTVVYYTLSSGLDSYFQSQTYTYGLCGPLNLDSRSAGWLNTLYFSAYLTGRLVSIPLSRMVLPSTIITGSLLGCSLSSILLLFGGQKDALVLFVATGFMGASICFQFGSGLTWLTSNVPQALSSRQVSWLFIGSNIGNCVFPPLASKLFHDNGVYSVFYMTASCVLFHLVVFAIMQFKAKQEPKIFRPLPQA